MGRRLGVGWDRCRSKLIVSYLLGQRGAAWANVFTEDIASRVASRIQTRPAMEAGLPQAVWTVEDMVKLMEPKSILDGLRQVA